MTNDSINLGIGQYVRQQRIETKQWSQRDMVLALDELGYKINVSMLENLERTGAYCEDKKLLKGVALVLEVGYSTMLFNGMKKGAWMAFESFIMPERHGEQHKERLRQKIASWIELQRPEALEGNEYREMPSFTELVEQLHEELVLDTFDFSFDEIDSEEENNQN